LVQRWGDETIQIVAYRSYGTPERLSLRGRVLEDNRVGAPNEADSAWRNLVNMYRRFESDEIPGARVLARFEGVEQQAVADREGYFALDIVLAQPPPADRSWHAVDLTLLEPLRAGHGQVRSVGEVLVPPPGAQFGVISDIDDTVIRTDATSLRRMLRATFLGNARTRLAFPGVAALYRALHSGSGASMNPLFFVSSSPWNLYDMLADFFEFQGIPAGPILLRDWGLTAKEQNPLRHRAHKLAAIRQVLDTYPTLPFLLIGDSGQEDPEIYHELVRLYPNRILAIYIRDVSRSPRRGAAIQALAEDVSAAGSTLVLAEDSAAAARHAAERGWITPAELAEVAAASAEDRTLPIAPAGDDEQTPGSMLE
jgi:phosphatidate phosphatase APP1